MSAASAVGVRAGGLGDEWAGAFTEATPGAWHGHGWESPSLLGWTDVDGDGVIEIWDETPYGGISRCGEADGGSTRAPEDGRER